MRESTKAYIAGCIDGDGHIGISSHGQYSPCIQLVGQSKELMDYIQKCFGGTYSNKNKNRPDKEPFYEWNMYGRTAQIEFVESILPYLVIKKSQAKILLEFMLIPRSEYNPRKREGLYRAIKETRSLGTVETETLDNLDKTRLRAYIAGIFDTDGHTGTYRHKKNGYVATNVAITSKTLPLLKAIQNRFGGSICEKKDKAKKESWKPRYDLSLSGKESKLNFLLGILPYLIVKREKVKATIETLRPKLMIQSELTGDRESDLGETLEAA